MLSLTILNWVLATIGIAFVAFIFFIIYLYIVDITQTQHAIRRNYPVIGRFRYFFEHVGEFFRQYFFSLDREEMPFNRAERSWVYRAAKNEDNTVAFGSSKNIYDPGTVLFVNAPFPPLSTDIAMPKPVKIGLDCRTPYVTESLFNVSGMSYGAISKPAILALSNGARKAGAWVNTGEGGLSPYHLEGGADIVFQIGTAKYGVRNEEGELCPHRLKEVAAHEQVRMFEIKLAQGAKPGKGGILPAEKVTKEIAAIRGIREGEASISPNRHHDVSNVEELLAMIDFIRETTGKPCGIKIVVGAYGWLDGFCETILARGDKSAPDFITVDGGNGGTGAAPMSLMDDVGLPLDEALPMLADTLTRHNLKERIKIIASGKLLTPNKVAWALCMGADFIVSARGNMFALGCIQSLKCNQNTCPTGIATHNLKLQKGLDPTDKAIRVEHYLKNMVKEVGIIAHSCGFKEPRQLCRKSARLVIRAGYSKSLHDIYPPAEPIKVTLN